MYRRSLPAGHGMLFDFGVERDVAMWMQNTYVSLDMVFIRADGRIARVAERDHAAVDGDDIVRRAGALRAGAAGRQRQGAWASRRAIRSATG